MQNTPQEKIKQALEAEFHEVGIAIGAIATFPLVFHSEARRITAIQDGIVFLDDFVNATPVARRDKIESANKIIQISSRNPRLFQPACAQLESLEWLGECLKNPAPLFKETIRACLAKAKKLLEEELTQLQSAQLQAKESVSPLFSSSSSPK